MREKGVVRQYGVAFKLDAANLERVADSQMTQQALIVTRLQVW